jgi:hypothetical protein
MTMDKEAEAQEPLDRKALRLRDLTERTGALHEEQLLQLKLWPMVVFDRDPETSQAEVDQEKMMISFSINWKPRFLGRLRLTQHQRLKMRMSADRLMTWTQNLLGPSWSVSVFLQEGELLIDQLERKVNLRENTKTDPLEELTLKRGAWRDRFKGPRPRPSS